MTAWTVLATCGPAALLGLWWLHRITTLRQLATTPLPDAIAVIPATRTQDAILYARTGWTTRYYPVPGTRRTATPEEPQP